MSRNAAEKAARARWAARRRRLIGYGQWDPFMPAEPVRAHLQALAAIGMPRAGVERALGLQPQALRHAASGTYGHARGEKMVRETGEAVLAFWPKLQDFPDSAAVGSTGTRRRADALAVGGWSRAALAVRADRPCRSFKNSLNRERVSVPLARTMVRLYDELWNQRPEDHGVKAWIADRVRREAQAAGLHGPLAWDDDTIDDPFALPQNDAVAAPCSQGENLAARFLMGEAVILDAAARREVLVHLMEWTELTVEQVAARLEMTEAAASRAWERVKAKARDEGGKVPWRRVYVPQRERDMAEAASAA